MSKKDETTLLIKLPPDLKAAFQGLCKSRGVAVSAELRRFMADELAETVKGMTTKPTDALQSPQSVDKVLQVRQSYKDAVQADLELVDTKASAINAASKRKKAKSRKK